MPLARVAGRIAASLSTFTGGGASAAVGTDHAELRSLKWYATITTPPPSLTLALPFLESLGFYTLGTFSPLDFLGALFLGFSHPLGTFLHLDFSLAHNPLGFTPLVP